jgi:metal-responsive CopG/Arc/MetJ family transcriptional regulator
MVRFNVNMSDELHKKFKIHCVIAGVDMSEVARELIREYLERSESRTKTKKAKKTKRK